MLGVGGEWEAVLSKAVEQGLSEDAEVAAVPFSRPSAQPAADWSSMTSRLPEPQLNREMVASMTANVRLRIQAAAGRSVRLLRSAPTASVLTAELEAWLLEAGRLEASMEDAVAVGVQSIISLQEDSERERAEHHACKRAFELHLAQSSIESKRRAQLEVQTAREWESERQEASAELEQQHERLQVELSQARSECEQLRQQHTRRIRQAELEAEEAASRQVSAFRAKQRELEAEQASLVRQLQAEVTEMRLVTHSLEPRTQRPLPATSAYCLLTHVAAGEEVGGRQRREDPRGGSERV